MHLSRFLFFFLLLSVLFSCEKEVALERPNILFCIADDWGWPHAGVYGDSVVQTPTFDRLAQEGLLFDQAYVSSPSCTPSRSAILTGQHFWRLEQAANLWSTLDRKFPVYPLLLEEAGYAIGSWRKSWGPGDLSEGGYDTLRPAGPKYEGFGAFLAEKPADQPFCFWLGASDPHRPYKAGTGAASGINTATLTVPGFYPDNETIRNDIADYYYEVNRFDADVGRAIAMLDSIGELENTIIVVTGDHGMPFPRCKANLYDWGTRVPLVLSWGVKIREPKRIREFVSLIDLAPTFLELAGLSIPEEMSGTSLAPLVNGDNIASNFVTMGRERHTPAQASPSMDGYPARAIRTEAFLYIRNFSPDRWPAGVQEGATHPMNTFADSDNGPTKTFLVDNRDNPAIRPYYDWCFGQRPSEELYAIADDPYQLNNLADQDSYQLVKEILSARLDSALVATRDPRMIGSLVLFDSYPYRGGYPLNLDGK